MLCIWVTLIDYTVVDETTSCSRIKETPTTRLHDYTMKRYDAPTGTALSPATCDGGRLSSLCTRSHSATYRVCRFFPERSPHGLAPGSDGPRDQGRTRSVRPWMDGSDEWVGRSSSGWIDALGTTRPPHVHYSLRYPSPRWGVGRHEQTAGRMDGPVTEAN